VQPTKSAQLFEWPPAQIILDSRHIEVVVFKPRRMPDLSSLGNEQDECLRLTGCALKKLDFAQR
jgi:hypothetical protein